MLNLAHELGLQRTPEYYRRAGQILFSLCHNGHQKVLALVRLFPQKKSFFGFFSYFHFIYKDIELPIDDLLDAPQFTKHHSPRGVMTTTSSLLRPTSNHPHTSTVDAEVISLVVCVLSC